VSQFSGVAPTLRDFVPFSGIYPVGRLDKDSEGLMLLTDDGALQHRFTDPRFEHPRTYWAQVEGVPEEAALDRLRRGVVLQDGKTRPAQVRVLSPGPRVARRNPPIRVRKSIPDSWLELTLTEGRNRQVRRMTAEVGFPTLRLIRVSIGKLKLDGLEPGEWRVIPKPS
jgi:23S rRNA pseudouridine2457 synthase